MTTFKRPRSCFYSDDEYQDQWVNDMKVETSAYIHVKNLDVEKVRVTKIGQGVVATIGWGVNLFFGKAEDVVALAHRLESEITRQAIEARMGEDDDG